MGAGTFNGLYQITTSNNTFTVGTPSLQSDAIENSQVNLASLITNTGNVAAAVTIQLQVFNQGNILGVTYNGNSVTKATIGPVTIPAGGAYSAAWVYTEGPAAGSRDVIITVLDSNGNTVGAGTFNRLYQVTAPTQTGTGTFAVGMPGVVGTLTPGSQVALVSTIRNTTDTPATVTIQLQVFNQGNILGITYNGNSVTKATIGPVTIQPAGLLCGMDLHRGTSGRFTRCHNHSVGLQWEYGGDGHIRWFISGNQDPSIDSSNGGIPSIHRIRTISNMDFL